MSAFRNTAITAAVVAVLAAYTFYEYKNSDDSINTAQGERRIFHLLRDDLSEINLKNSEGEIQIVRDGDGWKMTKPVEDQADSSAVEGLLYTLLSQKGRTFQADDESKKTDWAEFGLQPAGSTIEIRGKGKTEKLEISSKNAFDGSYYVRLGDDLLLGDRGLSHLVSREPKSLRSRKIYRGPEDFKKVSVKLDYEGDSASFEVAKDNDKWAITPKPSFELDQEKIEGWVDKIKSFTASEVVADEMKDEDKNQWLLRKPSLVLKVDDWEITLGQDKDEDVYIFTNKRPTVYRMARNLVGTLRAPVRYFRDGKAPFRFDLELARSVEINTDKLKQTFVKQDVGWKLKEESAEKELDADKLISLMQSLSSLEAREFLPAKTSGAKLPAQPQVQIKDADGKVIFALQWGAEYKGKEKYNKDQTFRFTKALNTSELMGVSKDRLDRLIDSDLVRAKPKAENKTASTSETK